MRWLIFLKRVCNKYIIVRLPANTIDCIAYKYFFPFFFFPVWLDINFDTRNKGNIYRISIFISIFFLFVNSLWKPLHPKRIYVRYHWQHALDIGRMITSCDFIRYLTL